MMPEIQIANQILNPPIYPNFLAADDEEIFIPELIDAEKQIEIVDGKEEIKEMSGAKAGGIAARITVEFGIYLKQHKLGRVYGADTMFTIGENDRMPDVAFVANERIPAGGEPSKKWDFAPDLAVEVISPHDVHNKIIGKIFNYFAAGVQEVWLVEPEFELVTVYRSITETRILTKNDEITAETILPEFRLKLSEIFID